MLWELITYKLELAINIFMKKLIIFAALALAGCSTLQSLKDLWPKPYDPVLVDRWVAVSVAVDHVNCTATPTGWADTVRPAEMLWTYADFKGEAQRENLLGLYKHTQKMSEGGSKMFCELGKKTARARLTAARNAWEGR